jgi:hypothetical protein
VQAVLGAEVRHGVLGRRGADLGRRALEVLAQRALDRLDARDERLVAGRLCRASP